MTRSVSHNRRPMNMPSSGVKLSCSGNGGGLGIRRSRRLRSSASFSSSLTPIVVLLMVIICCLQLVEYASSARSPKETEDDPITEQEEVPIKEQEEEVPITEQEEKVPIKEQEDVLKEEEEEEPVKVQYIKPVEPSEEVPEDHDKHRSKGGHQAPPPKQHKAAIAQETGTANATAAGEEHPSFKPPLKFKDPQSNLTDDEEPDYGEGNTNNTTPPPYWDGTSRRPPPPDSNGGATPPPIWNCPNMSAPPPKSSALTHPPPRGLTAGTILWPFAIALCHRLLLSTCFL